MAREVISSKPGGDGPRLDKLWKAYKAQEKELDGLENALESCIKERGDLSSNYAKEQERLQKLWDAFKHQEDEMVDIKKNIPLLEEKLVERERTIEELQYEVSQLKDASTLKSKAAKLEEQNLKLKADLKVMQERLRAKGKTSSRPASNGASSASSSADKERLEKLYSAYQDLEKENRRLEGVIDDWEKWAKKVKPIAQVS